MSCANIRMKYPGQAALLLIFMVLLIGCEEDVAGPDPHEFPYSMWGIINPTADTQFVRVFPIETGLEPGLPEPLDARFTSVDLDTGEERVWQDSVLVDSTGAVGHVFYAPFRADWEHQYRLEITRGDGASSWVEVETPGEVRASLGDPLNSQLVILPVFLQGTQPRLLRTDLEVTFYYQTGTLGTPPFVTPTCHLVHYSFPYDERVRPWTEGWQVEMNLSEAYTDVRVWAAGNDDAWEVNPAVRFGGVEFHAVVGNEEWVPPGGVFDRDVLVQPGVLENVQNGFGFVASGYRLTRTWSLDIDLIAQAGFAESTFCEIEKESVVVAEDFE